MSTLALCRAAFTIKETGGVASVVFSPGRLTPEQLSQVLYEPSTVWGVKPTKQLIYLDSDFIHPKYFVTPVLVDEKAFKKAKKDALAQAAMALKSGQRINECAHAPRASPPQSALSRAIDGCAAPCASIPSP